MSNEIMERLGLFAGTPKSKEVGVRRFDAAYLFELGSAVRPLADYRYGSHAYYEIHYPLTIARDAIDQFINNSVFTSSLRNLHVSANALLAQINTLIHLIENDQSGSEQLTAYDTLEFTRAYNAFEPILVSELQSSSTYLVSPKGGFDNRYLIDFGEVLFPESLANKVPDAMRDVRSGARSLAFELWTASAFHFHRANEAVLRAYFGSLVEEKDWPKTRTMGTMLAKMDKLEVGDANIIAALRNIVNFHRNPIIHPGDEIENEEDAISLYSAIRAAIGYMLPELPASETPVVDDLPPISVPRPVEPAAK